jgi:hypothetical protein
MAVLEAEELAQRVAIVRRFRDLLGQQRDRFRSYLSVLDKQRDIIESGDAGELLAQVELEEQIVADIFSIQKVIDPLENMYHALVVNGASSVSRDEVPNLKASLDELKDEAVVRSSRNRELLSKRMVALRAEITGLRNNPFAAQARRSDWSGVNTASLIDIKG